MKKSSSLAWVYERVKKNLPYVFLLAFFNIIISVSFVLLARVSQYVIDSAVADNYKPLVSALLFIAIILLQIVSEFICNIISVKIDGKQIIALRNYLFKKVVRKNYADITEHHSGDLLNRFTTDVDQVVSGSMNIIPSAAAMITKLIAGVWALVAQNYIFAIIVIAVGFTFPLFGRIISKKYKYLHKEVSRTEGLSRSFLQESFANLVVIKTFKSEKPISEKLNEYMNNNLRIKIKRAYLSVIINLCLYGFFTLGYYIIIVWGAGQISKGLLSYGTLLFFLQIVSVLRSPMLQFSGLIPRYYSMIASAERLMEIENIEDEPHSVSPAEIEELKENFSYIDFKDLSFSYEDELILDNCNFTVDNNKITALVGESGSGKTTIFKLLLGLYKPKSGSVRFNNGKDIDASTRAMFSYVPQGNMILSGSIRDNITLCNGDIPEEDIINAAKAAVIYDYIDSLPNGFDTILSERGAGLSEGQIQRLSIARALLFDAPILLLDESTSALDEQTETQLLSNIREMTDKTVLFITHRNTSTGVCNNIIKFENKEFIKIK